MSGSDREPELLHRLRNHLAVIVSYADLLLQEMPAEDPRRGDVVEIRNAGRAASDLLPKVLAPGGRQAPPDPAS
jgi:hypothetical protein